MNKRCLYCYLSLTPDDEDFHRACSRSFFGTDSPPTLDYSLGEMAELASETVQRSMTVPGVQPKISLRLVKENIEKRGEGRLTIVGALGGQYILKPPHEDYPEMPQNEHLTMLLAKSIGLPVVESSLIRLSSGELSYITKRIDRKVDGSKVHQLDFFQILEAFDKYKSSMERVGQGIKKYSDLIMLDLYNYFELTVYCFLTGNNDMHLKNFSMIQHEVDEWRLAPAYDLLNVAIANPADTEEFALTIDGRKNKFNKVRLAEFGKHLGLNQRQVDKAFAHLLEKEKFAEELVDTSFLSDNFKEKYKTLLSGRYARLRN